MNNAVSKEPGALQKFIFYPFTTPDLFDSHRTHFAIVSYLFDATSVRFRITNALFRISLKRCFDAR